MCFKVPYKYMPMDRYMDANNNTQVLLSWSYNSPYPKSCADLNRIYTKIGVKYVHLHVLDLPSFPGLYLQAYIFLKLEKDHSL